MKSKAAVRLFSFVALLLVVGLACGGGTATPTAAPVEQPQEPQAEAPTQPPVAQDFFTEEFESDLTNWTNFVVDGTKQVPELVEGDFGTMSVGTDGGVLVFDLQSKGQWAYATYDPVQYDNVRVDVRAENRGVNNNNVSLICRYSKDEGWYEFNIANNGLFWIYYARLDRDNRVIYTQLADGGSNKIKSGRAVNDYGIVCQDRTLTLFINGYETRKLDDNNFVLRDGSIGLGVASFNELPVKVEFDSLKVSQP